MRSLRLIKIHGMNTSTVSITIRRGGLRRERDVRFDVANQRIITINYIISGVQVRIDDIGKH